VSGHTQTQHWISSTFTWGLFYTLLWALLSQNQGWGFGLLFITLALICSRMCRLQAPAVSLLHLPAFLAFFLQKLVIGGVDVAMRTLARRPAIEPLWVEYPLQVSHPTVHLSLSAIVGLLPGTLAARIDNNIMHVHVLDASQPWQHDIARLEQHLARLLHAVSSLPETDS
jgi:multicomponent Na+:H+ antiporter subunit E